MTIKFASRDARGVHTAYVESTDGSSTYTVKTFYPKRRLRRGARVWRCTCGDFIHRHAVYGGYCKHIVAVRDQVDLRGGFRNWPAGQSAEHTVVGPRSNSYSHPAFISSLLRSMGLEDPSHENKPVDSAARPSK